MQTGPKVSVLIPTYNYARFLDEAIQSVLNQTYTDYELIIVDNCSTDNTKEVVQKYLADERVSFVVNEQNLGMVGNWNKCLELARGEYIKFLCADDKFHPLLLEKFVAVMKQYRRVMLVTSFNYFFGDRDKQRTMPLVGLVGGEEVRQSIVRIGGKNWLGEPTAVMFRRSGLKEAGHFNPQLVALIDVEFWLRLLTLGDCYVVPEHLSYFRWHNAAQTALVRNKKFERIFELYRYYTSIKNFNQKRKKDDIPNLDNLIKLRASRCAALMYRVFPCIYKKENRLIFRRAWEIGRTENVVFDPVVRLFQGKAQVKIKKNKPVVTATN